MTQTAGSIYQELIDITNLYYREGQGRSPEAYHVCNFYQTNKDRLLAELKRRGLPTKRSTWWNGAQEDQSGKKEAE